MQKRENALNNWLNNLYPEGSWHLKKLAGDASFRQYFRLLSTNQSVIVMDAPPDKEPLEPFIEVNKKLRAQSLPTPKILETNSQDGFLILEDLGDQVLLNCLTTENCDPFYTKALDLLLNMQRIKNSKSHLPLFSKAQMLEQMNLFPQWFLERYLGLSLSNKTQKLIYHAFEWIGHRVSAQPYGFMHADFHSRNLMVTSPPPNVTLAIIDFQDAMHGPLVYDLVSLLKDCYIQWPEEKREGWLQYYYQQLPAHHPKDYPAFLEDFQVTGIQRHLKVLGIFARLSIRDNKPSYLDDMPLVMNYLMNAIEGILPLTSFHSFLNETVKPLFEGKR